MSEAPERIRVAQDAEGFWTCREAIPGSQEYVRADRIEALEREKEELRKERDRCHARLEIDHCFKLGDDDNLIRHEIPLNERSSFPDGITARDETIKLVERRAETAERQLAERDAVIARVRGLLATAVYRLCVIQNSPNLNADEKELVKEWATDPETRAALAGSGDAASKQYDTHQNGEDRALRSDIASPSTAGER